MITLKAPLLRLASAQPVGSMFRNLYANMAREAGVQEDVFARASYIEGLMGEKPGSLARAPIPHLRAMAAALDSGTPNAYIATFRNKYHMSDADISLLVGFNDLNLFGALIRGAAKGMLSGSARGLTPEDVAMSIASGLSPLTLKPLRYGPGKNVFYHLGATAEGRVTIGGLAAILTAEARNRAFDITRGTSKGENKSVSLYAPVGTGEGDAVIGDFIPNSFTVSSSDDVVEQIFADPAILNVVFREVSKMLTSPLQVSMWAAICMNPRVMDIENGEISVDGRALAMQAAQMTGVEYKGRSSNVVAAAIFKDKIRPAIRKVLDDDSISPLLLKNIRIRQLIHGETSPHARMATDATRKLARKLRADGLFQLMQAEVLIRAASEKLLK